MAIDGIGSLGIPGEEEAPLRVLLVDDHVPTCRAIATLLSGQNPRMDVIGTAVDLHSARIVLRSCAPDVVVLDLDLGGDSGLDLLPQLRNTEGTATIVFSATQDPIAAKRALSEGACAVVSKLAPANALIAAIRNAAKGRTNVMPARDKPPTQIGNNVQCDAGSSRIK